MKRVMLGVFLVGSLALSTGLAADLHVPSDYATIRAAITAASPGDTIYVAAGTYVEVGQIVIGSDLTVLGEDAATTIIKPAQDTGGSDDARGWFLVQAGAHFTLRNVTLDGDYPTRHVHTGIRSWGTIVVEDCTLRNMSFPGYEGRGLGPYGGTDNVIRRVTFSGMGRIGALVFGPAHATIDHCVYNGKGGGDWLDYAFEFGGGGGGAVTNSTISGCSGIASVDGSASAGILATTYFGSGTSATVLGCTITACTEGIAVGYGGSDTTTVVAHYNSLEGETDDGIGSLSSATVDATDNWWGTTSVGGVASQVWGPVTYEPFLLTNEIHMAFGGHRLADTQNPDGAWGWPLSGTSAPNTIGPTAMGLAKAYRATNDPHLLAALENAGASLLTKMNNFSPSDGYVAAELDSIFGGTTYRDYVNEYFYTPLHDGSYTRSSAPGTPLTTAAYIQFIRDSRASQSYDGHTYANLAAWDLGMGLVGAASCGVSGDDLRAWIDGVEAEINELDGGDPYPEYAFYDVIGLAGGLYGLAFVGEEFDPTAGEHAAAGSLADLADILASYQIAESGGFAWNKNYVIPYDYNEAEQETAYAILALETVGGHEAAVDAARNWLLQVQLATGGWGTYAGAPAENNEVTGEALWAIWSSPPATLALEAANTCVTGADQLVVEVWMHDVPDSIAGGQFYITYDNSVLDFVSAEPGDAPFTSEVYETVDETLGAIDYAVGIPLGSGGCAYDRMMAVLTFNAIEDVCATEGLVSFYDGEHHTLLTRIGIGAVDPTTVDLDAVTIDHTAPVIACPPEASVGTDAGVCDAVLVSLTDFDTPPGEPATYDYATELDGLADRSDVESLSGDWSTRIDVPGDMDYGRVRVVDPGVPGLTVGNCSGMFAAMVVPGSDEGLGPYMIFEVDADRNGIFEYGPDALVIAFVTGGVSFPQGCWYSDGLNGDDYVHVVGNRTGLTSVEFSSSHGGGLLSALRTHTFSGDVTWGELPVLGVRVAAGEWPGSTWFECFVDDVIIAKSLELPPTGTDECGSVLLTADRGGAPLTDVFQKGQNTITWTPLDCCGNLGESCTQTVMVNDAEAPVAEKAADIAACYQTQIAAEAAALDQSSATDNCTGGLTPHVETSGTCNATIIVTFTDEADNVSNELTYMTRVDGTAPEIAEGSTVASGDLDATCGATVPVNVVVTDNCGLLADDVTFSMETTSGTLLYSGVTKTQTDPQTVTISGNAVLSDVENCSATVSIAVDAYDCPANHLHQELSGTWADVTPPEFVGFPVDRTQNVDAGLTTAVLDPAIVPPTGSDCHGATVSSVRSDGQGLADPYPIGTTTITWTAMDSCGNHRERNQTVTIEPYNDVVVDIELQGDIVGDVTRCVAFTFVGPADSESLEKEVTFTPETYESGIGNRGVAHVIFTDLPYGSYDCVTAEDELHTLTSRVAPGTSGADWTVDFTETSMLIQGDLIDSYDGDPDYIDILDFGVFVNQWGRVYTGSGCGTPFPHADMDGDNGIGAAEFGFISGNFWLEGQTACSTKGRAADQPGGPRDSVTLDELAKLGLSELAIADLNGDGVIDTADVEAFMSGVTPKPRPPVPPALNNSRLEPAPAKTAPGLLELVPDQPKH